MKYDISKFNPCSEAMEFYNSCKTTEQAWETCQRGDWMLKCFIPKINITDNYNDCWEWTSVKHAGYGMIMFNGKYSRTNRIMWTLLFGTIPEKMCVLHKCDNPSCLNPTHLFLGTHQDNMTDKKIKGRVKYGSNGYKDKTHCPNGHIYSEENTYIYNNMRYCRTCSRLYKKNYKIRIHESKYK